eukprot:307924-Chlamydomonas_euryale.AAC.11
MAYRAGNHCRTWPCCSTMLGFVSTSGRGGRCWEQHWQRPLLFGMCAGSLAKESSPDVFMRPRHS